MEIQKLSNKSLLDRFDIRTRSLKYAKEKLSSMNKETGVPQLSYDCSTVYTPVFQLDIVRQKKLIENLETEIQELYDELEKRGLVR